MFFLGWLTRDSKTINLNGASYTLCTILKFVATSVAEAELVAFFLNMKEACIIRLTSAEIRHPHLPTPINCDNSRSTGILNGTVKKQQSRLMEMRYFYMYNQFKWVL